MFTGFKSYARQLLIAIKVSFAPKGVVGPHMSGDEWDEQFSNNKWKYLGDTDQREHYDQIVALYSLHGRQGRILDVGCGVGLLFSYFKDSHSIADNLFHGIDISKVAIAEARQLSGNARFDVLNYEEEQLQGKYDVVVFNETLYYFDHSIKTLEKCCVENLVGGGVIIISMCDHERHDMIWKHIEKLFMVLDVRRVANEQGISWTIKAMQTR